MVLKQVLVSPEAHNKSYEVLNGQEILSELTASFDPDDNAAEILADAQIEISRNHHLLLARKDKQVYLFARGRECCYHLQQTPCPVKEYKVDAEGLLLRLYFGQNRVGLYYFNADWKLMPQRDNYVAVLVDGQDVVKIQDADDIVKSRRTLLQYDRFMRRFIVKGTERV